MDVETNLNLSLDDIISLQKKAGKGGQKTTKSPQVGLHVYIRYSSTLKCRKKLETLPLLLLPLPSFLRFTALCPCRGDKDSLHQTGRMLPNS